MHGGLRAETVALRKLVRRLTAENLELAGALERLREVVLVADCRTKVLSDPYSPEERYWVLYMQHAEEFGAVEMPDEATARAVCDALTEALKTFTEYPEALRAYMEGHDAAIHAHADR